MAARLQEPLNNSKRPPTLPDLAPPQMRQGSLQTQKRKLSPLPEVMPERQDQHPENTPTHRQATDPWDTPYRAPTTGSLPQLDRPHRPQISPRPARANVRKHRKRPKYRLNPAFTRLLSIVTCVAVVIALGVMAAMYLFADSALEVFIDGNSLGFMALDREITSADFQNLAIDYIEERGPSGRMEIHTHQRITVEPARRINSRSTQSAEWMFGEIRRRLEYQIVARYVYIDNSPFIVLRSQACVDFIKEQAKRNYRNENTVDARLLVSWRVEPTIVPRDYEALRSTTYALERLIGRTMDYDIPYVVQSGDYLYRLARRFNTTLDRILIANNITINHVPHPGDILIIRTRIPTLTVISYDEIVEYVVVPRETIEIPNPAMPELHREIYYEGADGLDRLVRRVTRQDDQIINDERLEAYRVQDPINRVVEVGTRPAIERR